jgi:prophage regulatory protein
MVLLMGRYLMGAREIEDRLGVSRQRVYQLARSPGFPEPYDEVAMGKLWRIEDIEAWIREKRPALHDTEVSHGATPSRKGRKNLPARPPRAE